MVLSRLAPLSAETSRLCARVDRKGASVIGRPGEDGPREGTLRRYSYSFFSDCNYPANDSSPSGSIGPIISWRATLGEQHRIRRNFGSSAGRLDDVIPAGHMPCHE